MKREVIQGFLNLPGIAGVALMDGRSRPYFCGVNQTLNFQQKEALAQGIQQVVETTPANFQAFEFQFTGHQVYIYKLDHGMILLVLTSSNLTPASYTEAVELLKSELREDITNAIATFRLLAGNITLPNQNYCKRREDSPPAPESHSAAVSPATKPELADTPHLHSSPNFSPAVPPPLPKVESAPQLPTPIAVAEIEIKDLLAALNHLSQFTTQYLGTTVITNYWKSARPPIEWLNNFQVDRSAQISFAGALPPTGFSLSPEQHEWVRAWVVAFIERCSKVIRDFPRIIKQIALNDQQKTLLGL